MRLISGAAAAITRALHTAQPSLWTTQTLTWGHQPSGLLWARNPLLVELQPSQPQLQAQHPSWAPPPAASDTLVRHAEHHDAPQIADQHAVQQQQQLLLRRPWSTPASPPVPGQPMGRVYPTPICGQEEQLEAPAPPQPPQAQAQPAAASVAFTAPAATSQPRSLSTQAQVRSINGELLAATSLQRLRAVLAVRRPDMAPSNWATLALAAAALGEQELQLPALERARAAAQQRAEAETAVAVEAERLVCMASDAVLPRMALLSLSDLSLLLKAWWVAGGPPSPAHLQAALEQLGPGLGLFRLRSASCGQIADMAPALAGLGALTAERAATLLSIVQRRAQHEEPRLLARVAFALSDAGLHSEAVCRALLEALLLPHTRVGGSHPNHLQAHASGSSSSSRSSGSSLFGRLWPASRSNDTGADGGDAATGGAGSATGAAAGARAHWLAAVMALCVHGGFYDSELFARAADAALVSGDVQALRPAQLAALVWAYGSNGHTHLLLMEALAARAEQVVGELTLLQAAWLAQGFAACQLFREGLHGAIADQAAALLRPRCYGGPAAPWPVRRLPLVVQKQDGLQEGLQQWSGPRQLQQQRQQQEPGARLTALEASVAAMARRQRGASSACEIGSGEAVSMDVLAGLLAAYASMQFYHAGLMRRLCARLDRKAAHLEAALLVRFVTLLTSLREFNVHVMAAARKRAAGMLHAAATAGSPETAAALLAQAAPMALQVLDAHRQFGLPCPELVQQLLQPVQATYVADMVPASGHMNSNLLLLLQQQQQQHQEHGTQLLGRAKRAPSAHVPRTDDSHGSHVSDGEQSVPEQQMPLLHSIAQPPEGSCTLELLPAILDIPQLCTLVGCVADHLAIVDAAAGHTPDAASPPADQLPAPARLLALSLGALRHAMAARHPEGRMLAGNDTLPEAGWVALARAFSAATAAGLDDFFVDCIPPSDRERFLHRLDYIWRQCNLGSSAVAAGSKTRGARRAAEMSAGEVREALALTRLGLPLFGDVDTPDGAFRVGVAVGLPGVSDVVAVEVLPLECFWRCDGAQRLQEQAPVWRLFGAAAARQRALEARGWRLVAVPQALWREMAPSQRATLLRKQLRALQPQGKDGSGPEPGSFPVRRLGSKEQ